jgi:NADPH:quinone reductase-like Zn-dependent oxidoreductase
LGSPAAGLTTGDRVFLPRRSGTFSQFMKVKTARLFKAVNSGDPVQLSLMPINGATSYVLLTRMIALQPGEWIVQNGANSSCGRFMIGIARKLGLKTVNVVRRPELIAELLALGADTVVLDGDGLSQRVAEATGHATIRFVIDCVAGAATQRMAECLSVGGTLANYGMMSEQPCTVAGDLLFTRNLSIRGFCTPFYETDMTRADSERMMTSLATWTAEGVLKAKIAGTYPLADFKNALRHEMQSGTARDGKVVILPNPTLIGG